MDAITTPFYSTPWLVLGGVLLAGYIIWGLVKITSRKRVDGEGVAIMAVFACAFYLFAVFMWTESHNEEVKSQGLAAFEEYYDLTVVSGEIPFGTEKTLNIFGAHLNDEAGLQACFVDIDNAKYEVTCNGVERTGRGN